MSADPRPDDFELVRRWAACYRMRGLNPLPSRDKRPLVRYARYWEEPAPADLFDRFPTDAVQVMTGRRWRLLAVDLDGDEARERFRALGPCPETWATHSGGGGLHLWFRLPAGLATPLPRAALWRGGGRHQAIERLGDHCLVMAPPSLHPATGRRYRFLDRRHSPLALPLPAPCPGWLLSWRPPAGARPAPDRRDWAELVDSVPDKIDRARRWGVRFRGRPTAKGWWPCHAIDREDRTPSAAVHERSGCYVDLGGGTRLGFLGLAVALGAYGDVREAIRDLKGVCR